MIIFKQKYTLPYLDAMKL